VSYLFDNNISFRFAQMLAALGVDVLAVRHVPALGEDAGDMEILRWLRGRECVLISGDRHIRSRPLEVTALRESRVTALFLDRFWSKQSFWQQAAWLVARWPLIEQFASSALPATCGVIQQRGRIRLL
jgi:predicted nuclease of predicted toxin-antitoxin system